MPEQNLYHQPYKAAVPLVFSETCGHFMPGRNEIADTGVAVLFVSTWGFEEMSSRRFVRHAAEALSDLNIASLRFDFPGTGDSLRVPSEEEGLSVWHNAIKAAASELQFRTKYERLIVVAQSSGALVVSGVLNELPKLHGCVFINPVISGRQYLREVALWSSVIDDNLEIPTDQRDRSPGYIAGLKMPSGIAADVKSLKFKKIDAEAPIKVMIMQPNGSTAIEADHLVSGSSSAVEMMDFPGFREMVANVTISKVPMDVVANLAEWISKSKLPGRGSRLSLVSSNLKAQLRGDGFVETHVRFGQSDNLSGTLCTAMHTQSDTAVLFLTTAYERHASWGCMHMHLARALAKQGITALRFDAASVGDSPCRPGAPEQVLYSDWLKLDVTEAIDFLESKGFRKVVLAARCSGGYVAFQTALDDHRVKGLVTVNQDAFFWPEGKPVDELLKFVPKDFHKYATKLLDFGTLKRLWNGDIDVSVAMRNISAEFLRRCGNVMEPLIVFDRAQSEAIRKSKLGFASLSKRHVVFSLLYGEGDIGLRAIDEVFGSTREKLKQYDNVELTLIAECDHNLTKAQSRQIYLDKIKSVVMRTSVQKDEAPVTVISRSLEAVTATFSAIAAGLHSFESKLVQLFQII